MPCEASMNSDFDFVLGSRTWGQSEVCLFFFNFYLFWVVLGLCSCASISLVAEP